MDIVMTGRNVDVPAHYRVHVTDKLAHLQRYNSHVIRYDVELDYEKNPRQSKTCQRVEITGTGKGPTMRAEACGPDFYTALDAAVGKLEARLRRSHDRRVHHGRHQPTSVATATAPLATTLLTDPGAHQHTTRVDRRSRPDERQHVVGDQEHLYQPLWPRPSPRRLANSPEGQQRRPSHPRHGRSHRGTAVTCLNQNCPRCGPCSRSLT
jgi:ribosomal subunit interface protein